MVFSGFISGREINIKESAFTMDGLDSSQLTELDSAMKTQFYTAAKG
jgi:hypothetical protein